LNVCLYIYIIFLILKKYIKYRKYFKCFGSDMHALTQHAATTFKIKNEKNNAPYSFKALTIYNVVHSTNTLYVYSVIFFPIKNIKTIIEVS
jgi:hypothetical protein